MAALNKQIIPKNIKAVFFDLYGTLLIYGNMGEAWTDWFLSVYNSFQKYGLSMAKDRFSVKCNGFFERPEPPIEKDGLTIFERRIKRLSHDVNLDLQVTEIKSTVESAIESWYRHIILDPDAQPTLERLKQNKILGLITNFDHPPHIYALLAEFRLIDFFDVLVISGEVGFKKPDKRIFLYALNHFEFRPEQAVYVGDTFEDICGAKGAGFKPILIRRDRMSNNRDAMDFRSDRSDLTADGNAIYSLKDIMTIKRLADLLNI